MIITKKKKYTDPNEMQKAIDAYFKDCEGTVKTDENGEPVLDKNGDVIITGAHPPTITGLALSLGFRSRQALLNYQSRSEAFEDIISVAKLKCEEYAERHLYDKYYYGAKYSLENNFKGWGRSASASEKNTELSKLYEAISKPDEEEDP